MKIRESAEDYLEAILVIFERKGSVRSIDIANELEFSKPSVSIAMKNLRENGYITMDKDGYITLTKKGKKIADMDRRRRTSYEYVTGRTWGDMHNYDRLICTSTLGLDKCVEEIITLLG